MKLKARKTYCQCCSPRCLYLIECHLTLITHLTLVHIRHMSSYLPQIWDITSHLCQSVVNVLWHFKANGHKCPLIDLYLSWVSFAYTRMRWFTFINLVKMDYPPIENIVQLLKAGLKRSGDCCDESRIWLQETDHAMEVVKILLCHTWYILQGVFNACASTFLALCI
jgi:hypothetical protein